MSCEEGRRIGIVVVVVRVDDLEDDYLELGRRNVESDRDEENTAM